MKNGLHSKYDERRTDEQGMSNDEVMVLQNS